MRECGECTKCCEWPMGTIYGHNFGGGKPCNFLKRKERCTIYDIRPESPCRTYQCAWSQELFPEWMRPDKCGVLISVEGKVGEQFLRVSAPNGISNDIQNELDKFSKDNNCKVIT